MVFQRSGRYGGPRGGKPYPQPVKTLCNSAQLGFVLMGFKPTQVKKFMQPLNAAPQLPAGAGKQQKVIPVSRIPLALLGVKKVIYVVQQAAARQRAQRATPADAACHAAVWLFIFQTKGHHRAERPAFNGFMLQRVRFTLNIRLNR